MKFYIYTYIYMLRVKIIYLYIYLYKEIIQIYMKYVNGKDASVRNLIIK